MNEPDEALFRDSEYVQVAEETLGGWWIDGLWCEPVPVVIVRQT